jgi:hypothetical protein
VISPSHRSANYFRRICNRKPIGTTISDRYHLCLHDHGQCSRPPRARRRVPTQSRLRDATLAAASECFVRQNARPKQLAQRLVIPSVSDENHLSDVAWQGAASFPLPSPFSRLTREISERAQLSKFASPSLAQPSCSPLAHVDPRAHGPVPHKLPIDTGKARNLGVEHLNGCSPRLIGAIRLCHSKQKGRGDAAHGKSGRTCTVPSVQKFPAPTARPQYSR